MNPFEDFSFEIILILTTVLVLFATMGVIDNNRWNEFKEKHQCKVVSRQNGELFNTYGSNGSIGIGSTSSKTGWLCDDGITYIR